MSTKTNAPLPKPLLRKFKRRSNIFTAIYLVLFLATFIPSMKVYHAQQQVFSDQQKLWPKQAALGSAVQSLLKMPARTPAENQQLTDLMAQQSSLSTQLLSYSNQSLAASRLNLRYTNIRLVIVLGALAGFIVLAVKYRRTLHRFRNNLCLAARGFSPSPPSYPLESVSTQTILRL